MKFKETRLKGAYIIDIDPVEDERGSFSRTFCGREFQARGLTANIAQCSVSFNKEKGMLRGLHYQSDPYKETKLVRCIKGAIYDVILDLRRHSETFKQWTAVELNEDNKRSLYIPEGFAHGFQVLEERTEVFYQISEFYHPECARGVRWNDTAFGIKWPLSEPSLSDKDRNYSNFYVDNQL